MTKQEVLEKLKFDRELRNRTKDTIRDYEMHVRLYQDYYDNRLHFVNSFKTACSCQYPAGILE